MHAGPTVLPAVMGLRSSPPFLALSLEAGLGPPCGEEEEAVSEGSGSQVEGGQRGRGNISQTTEGW